MSWEEVDPDRGTSSEEQSGHSHDYGLDEAHY